MSLLPSAVLQSAVIDAHRFVTIPIRRRRIRQLSEQGCAPMSVLFYHRVADTSPNPWTISCEEFRRQVDYCREHFQLVGLDEIQRRIADTDSTTPTVTFTFDDGYADNSEFALPLLAELNVPCVYFACVGNVLRQEPFPHDLKAGQPLPVNSPSQLREASASGIEIGLHTDSHVDFSQQDDEATLRREIFDAKDALEQMLGQAVRYFAVPYGLPAQMTSNVIQAAREAGLQGICSAYGAYNFPGQDAFHIRRFHGDPQFARFRNWLTYDQRKVKPDPVDGISPQTRVL